MAGAQSARGLFRATGKSRRPRASGVGDDGQPVLSAERPRCPLDFVPTPPEPPRAFLRAERDRLQTFPALWEPACGDGAMAREMVAAGWRVFASDVVDRGWPGSVQQDFFEVTAPPAPAIVTNPPYNLVNWRDGRGRWIIHALDTLGISYMALLLSWSWPGAGGLRGVWARFPPARVYLMRWKIDFSGEGAPLMLNGWFVWDDTWRGETALRVLDRDEDLRQGSLL